MATDALSVKPDGEALDWGNRQINFSVGTPTMSDNDGLHDVWAALLYGKVDLESASVGIHGETARTFFARLSMAPSPTNRR